MRASWVVHITVNQKKNLRFYFVGFNNLRLFKVLTSLVTFYFSAHAVQVLKEACSSFHPVKSVAHPDQHRAYETSYENQLTQVVPLWTVVKSWSTQRNVEQLNVEPDTVVQGDSAIISHFIWVV